MGWHICSSDSRFGSINIGFLLKFTYVLLVPDSFISKPVWYLEWIWKKDKKQNKKVAINKTSKLWPGWEAKRRAKVNGKVVTWCSLIVKNCAASELARHGHSSPNVKFPYINKNYLESFLKLFTWHTKLLIINLETSQEARELSRTISYPKASFFL